MLRLPASVLLVAAANPCACGWLGTTVRECTCPRFAIERYRSRLSGPLLDRIDLQVVVNPVKLEELRSPFPGEASVKMRERVIEARDRQVARLAPFGIRCNAEMTTSVLRATCPLGAASEQALVHIVEKRKSLTARSIDRLIKVARTNADLNGHDAITPRDLFDAAKYRTSDPLSDPVLDEVSAAQLEADAATRAVAKALVARTLAEHGPSITDPPSN